MLANNQHKLGLKYQDSWQKKTILKYIKENEKSVLLSLALSLGLLFWYFALGQTFEWRTIEPIDFPILSRFIISAITSLTVGNLLYHLFFYKILSFFCRLFGVSKRKYEKIKAEIWKFLMVITFLFIVPVMVKFFNAVVSFFYNIYQFLLYVAPPVGFAVIVLSIYLLLKRAKQIK